MNSKRYERICEMLARRQPDLTVCMEQVHKPHNVSAVIRTADAVGVHEVHGRLAEQPDAYHGLRRRGQQQLGAG